MIIPAGPHKLWVAYYENDAIAGAVSEQDVARLVSVKPIIGWVWDEEDAGEDGPVPRPLTIHGLIQPGTIRSIGEDPVQVHVARIEAAVASWNEARKQSDG